MARKTGGLIGINTVTAGLTKRLVKMNALSLNGMRAATAFIREDMERTPPLVPIDTGNLRASWFTEFVKKAEKGQVGMVFGFNANYAFFVHENIDKPEIGKTGAKNWNRPGSGPKFLQAALNRNTKTILELIGGSMK